MTTEEKAKAYDEAIKRARNHHDNDGLTLEQYETIDIIFPELKESEDERVKRCISDVVRKYGSEFTTGTVTKEKMLAWLEKQGEQKPTDKVEPKSNIEKGKWYVCDTSRYTDFVVGKAYFCPKNGMLKPNENEIARYVAKDCFHLWTIQDAKDGDVLCYENKNELRIFIYENGHIHYHCCYYNGHLTTVDSFFLVEKYLLCYIYPATKEQHDLLFQKMKEASYEWDAEKKELKKIEQNFAWSEEDEDAIGMAIIALEDMYDEDAPNTTYGGYNLPFNKAAERLKSLKGRVQPKQEWSEEDIRNIEDIDSILFYNKDLPEDTCMRLRNWLKSLRPQNTWKPSDEQMIILQEAIGIVGQLTPRGECLKELVEQLKKLKGY